MHHRVAPALCLSLCLLSIWPGAGSADEPPLPAGLAPADTGEPALPAGLGSGAAPPAAADSETRDAPGPLRFWDTRLGVRTGHDGRVDDDLTLAETRLRLEHLGQWRGAEIAFKGDLLLDGLADDRGIDIGARDGWLQVREFRVGLRPHPRLDLGIGRQVLTWGTGDLVFINDLFPKDFNSFFVGRAEEYLKSPVDGVRASAHFDLFDLDLVWSPRFDPDLYLDPRRLSFFGSPADGVLPVDRPDDGFADDEWAARVHRRLGSWELALYGYDGFWKGPAGFDLDRGLFVFPRLAVWGGSVRGPLAGGIVNAEYGRYVSKDAGRHDGVYAPPGEQRLLLGYQRELARELTLGLQYYRVHIVDYDDYRRDRLPGSPRRDRDRQVITARLTRLLMNQDLRLSLFAFASPTDEDAYLRPQLHYRLDDSRSVEVGANVFLGERETTFFGQLEDNSNLYAAFRYGF